MGHTFSVSLGLSLKEKKNKVICIDGDGSFFMHLGSFGMLSKNIKKNLTYILLDNEQHETVGNVKINFGLDIKNFAKSVGFEDYVLIDSKKKSNLLIKYLKVKKKLTFIHVKTKIDDLINLPRPNNLIQIKTEFLSKNN